MASVDSIYCPSCRKYTSIEMRARKSPKSRDVIMYEIGECNQCSEHFLVTRLVPSGKILTISPHALPKPVDEAIPSEIRADLEEAYKCQTVEAWRAAATMARRAIQNICLEKGAPKVRNITTKEGKQKNVKNDLVYQIDWLYDQRIITSELRNWAHEIRVVGNAGAHPGDAEDQNPVTKEDAEDILNLVEAFCQLLYVASSIYKKRQTVAVKQEQ